MWDTKFLLWDLPRLCRSRNGSKAQWQHGTAQKERIGTGISKQATTAHGKVCVIRGKCHRNSSVISKGGEQVRTLLALTTKILRQLNEYDKKAAAMIQQTDFNFFKIPGQKPLNNGGVKYETGEKH